jgi:glycosyltransferase involved in cell wall biosynthesis
MRILLACGAFRCICFTVEEIVDSLAAEFAAVGHTVAVLSTPYLTGLERIVRPGLECIYLRIPDYKWPSWRHPERLVRRPRGVAELESILRRWRPDVVSSHLRWEKALTLLHACRSAGVPMVHTFHGFTIGRGYEEMLGSAGARAITTVSAALKRELEQAAPAARAAHVIVSGVDYAAARAAEPLQRERPYILSAARLYLSFKAIDALIAAFAILAPRHPQIDLLIAGDGPDRAQLDAMIAKLGLEGRVQMLGFVPHDALWSYYKGATMFAMPSRFAEPLGMVFLEAMACGTPIVATRTGGIPEIVPEGEAGRLVDRNEPAEIAGAIRRLLDDPDLRARMGRRGQELAVERSWARAAKGYLEVYASCLDEAAARR